MPLLAEELGWNWIWSIFPTDEERFEESLAYLNDSEQAPDTALLEQLDVVGFTVEIEGEEGWQSVERANGSSERWTPERWRRNGLRSGA